MGWVSNLKEGLKDAWNDVREWAGEVWAWVKGAIQKCWNAFKAFCVKVASYIKTVIRSLKQMIYNCLVSIANGIDKAIYWVLKKIKRFFIVVTPKSETGFTETIKTAVQEGKIGKVDVPIESVFDLEAEFDYHIIQTDENINTENVYSISADKISEDMKRFSTGKTVTEINFGG